MQDNIKKYTEANRIAWNEVMPQHQQASKEKLDNNFATPGFIIQYQPELLKCLHDVSVENKDIIHLCCNNGSELLSLKNMGAGRCVGIDISDLAVDEANQRAKQSHIDCQFLRHDIYELPESLFGHFDIVHITAGGIGWLPDLNVFYQVVNKLLRKGGKLLMHEMHPLGEIIPFDDADTDNPLQIIESYFQHAPIEENSSLDYVGKSAQKATTQFWNVHTLSDIIMGGINNGMSLTHFSEYKRDISAMHSRQENQAIELPLSFILIAQKV